MKQYIIPVLIVIACIVLVIALNRLPPPPIAGQAAPAAPRTK